MKKFIVCVILTTTLLVTGCETVTTNKPQTTHKIKAFTDYNYSELNQMLDVLWDKYRNTPVTDVQTRTSYLREMEIIQNQIENEYE